MGGGAIFYCELHNCLPMVGSLCHHHTQTWNDGGHQVWLIQEGESIIGAFGLEVYTRIPCLSSCCLFVFMALKTGAFLLCTAPRPAVSNEVPVGNKVERGVNSDIG